MSSVHRAHTITLPLPVDIAFGCFTPRGETEWIATWDPRFHHPPDGATCEGMAFETVANGVRAMWTCTRWEPEAHMVQYVRFSAGSHIAIIDVRCEEAEGETAVRVAYRLTALAETGEAYLGGFSEAAYGAMIAGWRDLLAARYDFV